MSKHGKKYRDSVSSIDLIKKYDFHSAIDAVLAASFANFDESIDIAIKLGVDPRHADQMVRSSVVLPHGIGKKVKILVFAKGEKELEAKKAGADYVGAEDLIKKISTGWLNFDKAVSTPDMMGLVGKIGRILGPRGLMPNAKTRTVTFDLARTIKEIKSGRIDFKVEKTGIIHSCIGKVSFGVPKILDNVRAFIDTVIKLKPSTSKGTYVKNVHISSTMGPGIKIDVASVSNI